MADTPAKTVTAPSGRTVKPRALVVDDDTLIGYATMADLVDEGFDVVLCFNGQDGLDAALAEAFDLVVTDLVMPVMSGLDMIAALRRAGATMPIILVTANAPSSLPPPAFAGFDETLPKPYRAAELKELARDLIGDTA